MKELGTVDVTIEYIKKQFDNHSYIGNDLILLDHFDNFPARVEACKMNCLFVAMCLSGTAEYVVDAKKYTIHKDDMIVLYGGQLVSDYMLSRDCRAMSIIVSEGFLQETMKGIRESSSLFIFARTHPAFHLGQHEVQVFMEYYNMTKRKINDTNNRFGFFYKTIAITSYAKPCPIQQWNANCSYIFWALVISVWIFSFQIGISSKNFRCIIDAWLFWLFTKFRGAHFNS